MFPFLFVLLGTTACTATVGRPSLFPNCKLVPKSPAGNHSELFSWTTARQSSQGWLVTSRFGDETWVPEFPYDLTGDWAAVGQFAACRRVTNLHSRFTHVGRRVNHEMAIVLPRWTAVEDVSPAHTEAWRAWLDRQTRLEVGWAVTLTDAYAEINHRLASQSETSSFEQLQRDTVPYFEAYQSCVCGGRCVDQCAELPALLTRAKRVESRQAADHRDNPL